MMRHLLLQQHQGSLDQGDVQLGETGSRTETKTFSIRNPLPPLPQKWMIFPWRTSSSYNMLLLDVLGLSQRTPKVFCLRSDSKHCRLVTHC